MELRFPVVTGFVLLASTSRQALMSVQPHIKNAIMLLVRAELTGAQRRTFVSTQCWFFLVQFRFQWWAFVKTITNLKILFKAIIFLNSRVTIGFSTDTLPFGACLFCSPHIQDEHLRVSANSVLIHSSTTERSVMLFSFVGQIYKLFPHTCATESKIL
jgi:hypothetical protein